MLTVSIGVTLTDEVPLPDIARFVCTGVALITVIGFIFFKSDIAPPEKTTLGPPHFVPPLKEEIADEQLAVGSYAKNTTEFFFDMLGDLPKYLVRIRETVEILGDTPQLRVTRHKLYYVGPDAPRVLLIPLARVEKGTLLDDFIVTDGCGNIVPTLPYNRFRGLLALALDGLVETAMHNSADDEAVDSERKKEVVGNLVRIICGRHRPRCSPGQSPDEKNAVEAAARAINEALDSISSLPITPTWQRRIRNFCDQQVDYYIIVAEIPVNTSGLGDGHLTLTYSHRVPFDAMTTEKERSRGFFGLKPSTIDIPLNLFAFQVETYHQEIVAEPGQYVFDHHLERLDSGDPVKQADLQTEKFMPYVRLYHGADARPNAHLYIRRQVGAPPSSVSETNHAEEATSKSGDSAGAKPPAARTFPSRLKSVVAFREIPPGTVGAATIIALASAGIISFFALTHAGLDIDPNAQGDQAQSEQIKATLNSDVPALLLALPAFVGVLIGSWLDLSHLRRASLTTYLALTMTMFLSLGSALYFVYDANNKLVTALTITFHYSDSIKLTTDWIWLALMAVSITHCLFLLRMLVDQSRYYAKRVRKRLDKQLQFG